MNSVVRWGRNGLIVGAILGLIGTIGGNGIGLIFSNFGEFIESIIIFAVLGGVAGVTLRKWVFRTFWQ